MPRDFQRLEVVEDRVAALRIDADGRLVEQQDVGIVQQAGGQVQPPLHAAAEGLHAIVRAVGEADQVERGVDRLVERGARQAVERAEEAEVRARGQLVVEREILRHEADPALLRIGVAAQPRAVDEHVAVVRRRRSPAIIETVVVLPAPFGPSRPTSCPRSTVNETSSTATSLPNVFRRWCDVKHG